MNDKIIEKKKTPSNQVPSYLEVSLKYYFSLFKKFKSIKLYIL